MTDFTAYYQTPILPTALALCVGLYFGFRWLGRGLLPGIREGVLCTAVSIPFGYLGFVLTGQPLVRPWLFVGLLIGLGATAMLVAFAIATRRNRSKGMLAAALVLAIAILPAISFVLPNAVHRALHWNPSYWLSLGWILAHTDDATAQEMPLRFPAYFEASYALAPILIGAGTAWYLLRRVRHRELLES